MVRVTTWSAWRIRYSSSLNSRGCSVIARAPRVTRRDSRPMRRSPTCRGRSAPCSTLRRPRASTPAVRARQQLAEGEGLGEVIVAAAAQPADALIDIVERGQDQDGRAVAGLAQRLDDRQPVDVARQHAVHDDDVVRLAGGEEQPVAAIAGVLHGVPGLAQAAHDEARHPFVVLDDEDLHGVACAPCVATALWAGSSCGCWRAQRTTRRSRYR